ncbi:putative protein N(5)-glutamine methyltransferase [Modestobacter sp. I12A-02628]|uniref:peptide chain release factor N(5)-glutamine methyltransferase n=1 Tax=Goekera deserti TaxID=2497753 RepID=A0A7K3WH24_9ACTN|nr:putative protein N(5)-glutamine methyltransferase [Goekera deserti]MPR00048.1 putative protein N(5)-glutamine methyltransferase [Goekera deserti]NDI49827.1 putative protein N(5)-glutamine methyltransferase [Goekera deserti]NEL55189.1 putative protein N(5)-glutamine methyltransferase [Goekera deserti]
MSAVRDEVTARLRAAGCVFAEEEADLLLVAAASPAELDGLVRSRVAGLPLEHLLGWVEFCGTRMSVGPGVFTPRRRTRFLVAEAVARCAPGAVVVDLCCGCGAVGAAVAARVPGVQLHVADVDPVAVGHARRNVAAFGGQAHVGDLYEALPAGLRGRVDVLVVNAPYVPSDAIALMPPEARDHEPHTALDGGDDGVHVQRRVAAGAGEWLAPGGHLLVETGQDQAPLTVRAVRDGGLDARVLTSDELCATVVVGARVL